jgi:transcriptional regulator with XRE-family HTH domain
MPWVPIKDALRTHREGKGYTIAALARRAGMSERQIGKIESDHPPGAIFGSNLSALAKVLDCKKEDLATLVAKRPKVTATDIDAPKKRGGRRSVHPRTVAEIADAERAYRLSGEQMSPTHCETPHGRFELLGAERIVECRTQYGAFDGQRFLVTGLIEQHKPLPTETAKILSTAAGIGGRFEISRLVFYDVPLAVTVLTATAELTRKMLDYARDRSPVGMIVRVLVARPKGRWKGFVGLEKDSKLEPFAFVVDHVLDAPPDPTPDGG